MERVIAEELVRLSQSPERHQTIVQPEENILADDSQENILGDDSHIVADDTATRVPTDIVFSTQSELTPFQASKRLKTVCSRRMDNRRPEPNHINGVFSFNIINNETVSNIRYCFKMSTIPAKKLSNRTNYELFLQNIKKVLILRKKDWFLYGIADSWLMGVHELVNFDIVKNLDREQLNSQTDLAMSRLFKYIEAAYDEIEKTDEKVRSQGKDRYTMNKLSELSRRHNMTQLPLAYLLQGQFMDFNYRENQIKQFFEKSMIDEWIKMKDDDVEIFYGSTEQPAVNPFYLVQKRIAPARTWNGEARSGILTCLLPGSADWLPSFAGISFERFAKTFKSFQCDGIHMLFKGSNFWTFWHADTHSSPHLVVYRQLVGSTMFSFTNPVFGYWIQSAENDQEAKKRFDMVSMQQHRLLRQTLQAGQTLLLTPCAFHQAMVPNTCKYSIVEAFELFMPEFDEMMRLEGFTNI